MSLNYIILFLFKDVPTGASKTDSPLGVLWKTVLNILEPRLIAWLVIMSGFWMMMYQLWDLQPNFIADWIDSSAIARSIAWLPATLYGALTEQTPRGPQIPQQVLLSMNAFCIILGVIGVSWLTRKMRTLTAMLGGMLLATAGVLVAGLTMSPWMLVLGIICFSLGEMTTGPKKNEYLGLIAPPGKKGLYLGYVNIPVGVGVYVGSTIAGYVYGHYGEKATLALKYLAQHTPLGTGKAWDGNVLSLESLLGVKRTEAMLKLQELLNIDAASATRLLWETYDPHLHVWIPFACIGVASAIALAVFGQMAKRWSDMNA
jgi:MFS family permease